MINKEFAFILGICVIASIIIAIIMEFFDEK